MLIERELKITWVRSEASHSNHDASSVTAHRFRRNDYCSLKAAWLPHSSHRIGERTVTARLETFRRRYYHRARFIPLPEKSRLLDLFS